MSYYILHHQGAYNIWNTVVDAPVYESALTRTQLPLAIGAGSLAALDMRLERAHATGSSGYGDSLDDCIAVNRAGPGEANLSRDQFIAKYLTLEKS